MTYIKGLDGLRAIAVFWVCLCHSDLPLFRGGFIGVEVFFVLSGFLITTSLTQEYVTTHQISLIKFYIRRVRRLFPALYFMLFVVLIYGFISSQELFQDYLKGAINAVLYLTNLPFRSIPNTDIFLHTWSLSLEEQYYFIWPVLLLIFLKFNIPIHIIGCILAVVTVTLMSLHINLSHKWYYAYSHILGGSSFALIVFNKKKIVFSSKYFCYMAFILLILLLIKGNHSTSTERFFTYPTAFIISIIFISHLKDGNSFLRDFFESKYLVHIGKISYAFYLWHYPIFKVLKYHLSAINLILVGFSITLILSEISWWLIEKHFTNNQKKYQTRTH